MEAYGDAEAEGHGRQLEEHGRAEEVAAEVLLGLREAGVGDVGAGDAGENADEDVDAEEGGDDAAGVEGRVVGDVVEEAAEDEVVGAFVDGAGEGD